MPKVLMGAPTTRDLPIPYVRSLWTTEIKGTIAWDVVYGQAVDLGRNTLVDRFLTKYTDFDYLLMHDTDATWAPGAVQRLLDRDKPVISGIIFKRSIPTVPTLGKFSSISVDGHYMYSFKDTCNSIVDMVDQSGAEITKNEMLLDIQPGQVREIDAAGAHFMLIRRDVLEKIGENWYECTRLNAGEDFHFCRKVQAAGYKLYADFSVFTGHHVGGNMEIGFREWMLYRDKEKLETEWIA